MDNPNVFTLNWYGRPMTLLVVTEKYLTGGGLAVNLIDESDGTPFATVSVNDPGVRLAADEFIFKTYSENEGLLEAMLAAGVVETTGRTSCLGPICRLRQKQDDAVAGHRDGKSREASSKVV